MAKKIKRGHAYQIVNSEQPEFRVTYTAPNKNVALKKALKYNSARYHMEGYLGDNPKVYGPYKTQYQKNKEKLNKKSK